MPQTRQIPVVITSAQTQAVVQQAQEAGARACVPKSIDLDTLFEHLNLGTHAHCRVDRDHDALAVTASTYCARTHCGERGS
jgi:CheY-like chemotaxis protein